MKEFESRQQVRLIESRFHSLNKLSTLVLPARQFLFESKKNEIEIIDGTGNSHNIVLFLFTDCLLYGMESVNDNNSNNNETTPSSQESQTQATSGKKSKNALKLIGVDTSLLKFGALIPFDRVFRVQDNLENYTKENCLQVCLVYFSFSFLVFEISRNFAHLFGFGLFLFDRI